MTMIFIYNGRKSLTYLLKPKLSKKTKFFFTNYVYISQNFYFCNNNFSECQTGYRHTEPLNQG